MAQRVKVAQNACSENQVEWAELHQKKGGVIRGSKRESVGFTRCRWRAVALSLGYGTWNTKGRLEVRAL